MPTQSPSYTNGSANGTSSKPDSPPVEVTRSTVQPVARGYTNEYDILLGRLLRQLDDHGSASFVGLTSTRRRAGVSTIAANIAIRAADFQAGPVLLVEANTAHPRQRRRLRARKGPGLVDMLGTGISLDKTIVKTRVSGLSLLGPGRESTMAPLAVMRESIEGLVQELRERFALVVFDLPASQSLSNWTPLVQALDEVLLVVASEVTTRGEIHQLQNQCEVDNITITGSILNRHRTYTPRLLRRGN
jgi:Mrp family chromosome partitioning ATPase